MKPGEKYLIRYEATGLKDKTIKIRVVVDEDLVVFTLPPVGGVTVYGTKYFLDLQNRIKRGLAKKLPGLSYEEYEALETNTSYQEDRKRDLEAFNEANGTDYKYYFEYVFERRFLGESCATIAAPFSLTRGAVREQIKKLDKLHSLS